MKTITIKFTVTIVALFLYQSVNAQFGWFETSAKGSKSDYLCFKNPNSNVAIYYKKSYNREKVLKEYPNYVWVDGSFLGYKTNIHNSFLEAVNSSFDYDKIVELANRVEYLKVGFDLDQDGNILSVNFSLDTMTLITTDELYILEENIRKLLIFKPIRKAKAKLMGGFGIATSFKEILAGEIPYIRKMEEQQRETERLFGD
jgi:hypothetical protein